MFKLDLNDTLYDKNIQALTKDTELQYDMTFISTKLDCLLKKLHFIVNQQGEKCKKNYSNLYIYNFILMIGVVVSSWVGMLNIVRHHLKQYHIRSQTISGEIKISDRQLVVQAFNSDENRFMVKIK
jgi:SNF2 family DNA or RNA helicase